MLQNHQDSVASYGIGGMSIIVAYLADIAVVAQQLAIIFGCLVVAIRLLHDGLKLYRDWIKR